MHSLNYKKQTLLLIFFSTLLRIFLGVNLEFGNDEVYYWLYAKYPAVSHFDHPSMVGFFIQFFTANLLFDSELCIRLAAIIPSSISMYVLFLIANYLKDEKAGFITVLLYIIHIWICNCRNIYFARRPISCLLVVELVLFYSDNS